MLTALLATLEVVLNLYMWVIIAAVVMSWLIQFNAVNRSNQFVYAIATGLYRLTEPIFMRIRRILPDMGGLDLSPIVVLLVIYFARVWLADIRFDLQSPF